MGDHGDFGLNGPFRTARSQVQTPNESWRMHTATWHRKGVVDIRKGVDDCGEGMRY